ncbi:MAG: rod shape-determining protein RodA, partial [bacterium]|nr:rod shape-determining protein RodA [bacterium]
MKLAIHVSREFDWYLFACWIALLFIGLIVVFSATHPDTGGWSTTARFHLLYIGVGIAVGVFAYFTPLTRVYDIAYILWLGCFLLLAGVELFGKLGMGAVRWIEIAGVRFQPSELMKLGVIIALARWLGDRAGHAAQPVTLLGVFTIAILPMMLVAAQPDLATSTIFLAPAMTLLIWSGYPLSGMLAFAVPFVAMIVSMHPIFVIIILVVGGLAIRFSGGSIKTIAMSLMGGGIVSWLTPWIWQTKLHEYQRNRILTFLNPDNDPLGKGYQSIQSKIAVGSGGFTGKGFLGGTQTQLDFLPIQHTDFVFSVLAEEWGFLGSLLLLLVLGVLFWRLWGQAYRAKNRNGGLLLAGIAGLWVYQIFVNVAMTLGLMPVAGIR